MKTNQGNEEHDNGDGRLSRFSRRHGLSFIIDPGELAQNESALLCRSRHECEVTLPLTLRHTREEPIEQDYRHQDNDDAAHPALGAEREVPAAGSSAWSPEQTLQ